MSFRTTGAFNPILRVQLPFAPIIAVSRFAEMPLRLALGVFAESPSERFHRQSHGRRIAEPDHKTATILARRSRLARTRQGTPKNRKLRCH